MLRFKNKILKQNQIKDLKARTEIKKKILKELIKMLREKRKKKQVSNLKSTHSQIKR